MVRALVLTIATRDDDGPYDQMTRTLRREAAEALPPGWKHLFVYAGGQASDEDDVAVVDDVEEGLVPGVARKTLAALKRHAAGYDYVVRTNLSTLWLWNRLHTWLDTAPRERLCAGTVDPRSGAHACGCAMIWSRDVVDHLLAQPQWDEVWDSAEPDDVVLTRVCSRIAALSPLPRLDVYGYMFPALQVHHAPHPLHDCLRHMTHVRFKSCDRLFDAASMQTAGLVLRHLRGLAPDRPVDLLLAVHLAQNMAASA